MKNSTCVKVLGIDTPTAETVYEAKEGRRALKPFLAMNYLYQWVCHVAIAAVAIAAVCKIKLILGTARRSINMVWEEQ